MWKRKRFRFDEFDDPENVEEIKPDPEEITMADLGRLRQLSNMKKNVRRMESTTYRWEPKWGPDPNEEELRAMDLIEENYWKSKFPRYVTPDFRNVPDPDPEEINWADREEKKFLNRRKSFQRTIVPIDFKNFKKNQKKKFFRYY